MLCNVLHMPWQDMNEYIGWDWTHSENVTDENIDKGLRAYTMYGIPDCGACVTLMRVNILDRALAFFKVARRRGIISDDVLCGDEFLPNVLFEMVKSTHFKPAAGT